jgi:hypothetical protein
MRYQRRILEDEEALRTRLRSLAEVKRGATVAGATDAYTSCCNVKLDESTANACTDSIEKSAWRCGGANRSLYRPVAQGSRPWKRREAWSMDVLQDVHIDRRRFLTPSTSSIWRCGSVWRWRSIRPCPVSG